MDINQQYDFLFTAEDLIQYVNKAKIENPDMTYLEIVSERCEELDIDVEKIVDIIPQSLLLKIEQESESLNLISKTSRLKI